MHELSVCQGLLSQVGQIARTHNAKAVSRIVLNIGPLSGIEPRLLVDAYPIAAAGGPAADAELIIEELPVRVRCRRCGAQSAVPTNKLTCPACGEWQTQLISGDELILARVELVMVDPAEP